MDPEAPHDLEHLEQTVSYLIYSRDLVQKSQNEIYKEYSILEKKYHDILDNKNKPTPVIPNKQKQLLEVPNS